MPRVVVTRSAQEDLASLIESHRLPPDTRDRLARSLAPLAEFPLLGAELRGAFSRDRFVLGPWRWMIIVYRFLAASDVVAILALVDGRTSTSPTANR